MNHVISVISVPSHLYKLRPATLKNCTLLLSTTMLQITSSTSPAKARLIAKHDDDVVIVSAVRTAITKVRYG